MDDLRLLLDSVPALVGTFTQGGVVDFANRQLLEYLGVTLEELRNWSLFVHEADRAAAVANWNTSIRFGRPFAADYRLRRSDGEFRWFCGHIIPLRNQHGAVDRWCIFGTDIDERREAEDRLRSSERYFRAIFDNIPALIGIMTGSGELELVNKASLNYHNLTLAELRQWETNDVVQADDLPEHLEIIRQGFAAGEPFESEHRLRRADGVYRWFQLRARQARDEIDGSIRWYCLETDIHDRKMAEEALLRNETRLLEVQRLSRTGAWRYDAAANIVESSPEIQRVYDVQPGEDISAPSFWFDRIHPTDRPRVQAQFERCVREKTDYRAGYRILLPDGSVRYQYATGHPVTNDNGDLVEFVGASMDMTEHWLATTELERASQAVRDLQARISRAAQVAAGGELAGSIAHEVNQPLAAVVANGHACLRWLSMSPPNITKAVEAVERIVKDGKDAGEVVRRVRALFKRVPAEKVSLDLSEAIREVVRLVDSYPARKDVFIDVALSPDVARVLADRVQLQQLMLNLMLNALEALEPVKGRAKHLFVRAKRANGDAAAIEISDNGIGLDDPVAAFEPFVTTKTGGMGLGLAICRSIVTAHGWNLSAERNADFGTTFTVMLSAESVESV
jgi:PAS domain S-box-containing protein